MEPPTEPPSEKNLGEWQAFGLAYLAEQLGPASPTSLRPLAIFEDNPLEGEGPVAIFDFEPRRDAERLERSRLVVGRTAPNYYPAYDLDADEAFCLHLGTRFMLVLDVGLCPVAASYDADADARRILDRIAPRAGLSDVEVAASFKVGDEVHTVLRCKIAGQDAYVFGADAPPGFSKRVHLPAPVAYRLHLGTVLQRESD
jgi:hypothetical protein